MTKEQIRDEVAKERGYESFKDAVEYKAAYDGVTEYPLTKELTEILDEATERYAKQEREKPAIEIGVIEALIELAMDGYKKHQENACHEEFLKEDRSVLANARDLVEKLKQMKSSLPPEISAEEVTKGKVIDDVLRRHPKMENEPCTITLNQALIMIEEFHRLNSQGNKKQDNG